MIQAGATGVGLGTLRWLDPREAWKSELYEFTPWLREHIGLLGEALGLELDVDVQQEVAVGLFSADLLGTDLGSKARVLVENQLAQTDHSHLGQLLTYAGGLDTDILVWVSTKVREEHRQALTWLNEKTNQDVLFFAVELQLIRIDESRPAPYFNVVVAPNDWQKSQSARVGGSTASQPSAKGERYRAFWASFIEELRRREPGFTTTAPERAPRQNWCGFSPGRSGFQNNAVFGWRPGEGSLLRAELYIDTGDYVTNKAAFDALAEQRPQIEAELGEELEWTRRDDIRGVGFSWSAPGSSTTLRKRSPSTASGSSTTRWTSNHVFGPRLKALNLERLAAAASDVAAVTAPDGEAVV